VPPAVAGSPAPIRRSLGRICETSTPSGFAIVLYGLTWIALHFFVIGVSLESGKSAGPYAPRMRLTWRITTVRQKVLFIVLGHAAIALIFLVL
jgi:hypothetical protein